MTCLILTFSCTRVKQLLDNINASKAPGPDGIHGCVLKYCSDSLKWILNEEFISYSDNKTYIRKCKEINILPISK